LFALASVYNVSRNLNDAVSGLAHGDV